jgi:hypothetical protein
MLDFPSRFQSNQIRQQTAMLIAKPHGAGMSCGLSEHWYRDEAQWAGEVRNVSINEIPVFLLDLATAE